MSHTANKIYDMRLRHDSSFLIAGPTHSGKTVFTEKLIRYREEIFDVAPNKIYWLYGQYQPEFHEKLKRRYNNDIVLIHGLPDNLQEIITPNSILVIDDLMNELESDKNVTNIFTRLTHHAQVTCIFLTQNLFQKGAEARTRSLNTSYIVLTKNPRDASQIRFLAMQMFPENPKYLISVFQDAVKNPYSYLFIDLHQETPDSIRLRTNIFPLEITSNESNNKYTVYLPQTNKIKKAV